MNLFTDLALIIPLRVDTDDRLWNLSVVLRFLETRFQGVEVILVEQDARSKLAHLLSSHPGVTHLFLEDGGPFCKSRCVNLGAQHTQRRFISIYDADILIEPEAISRALRAIDRGGFQMVLPFNRIFVDVNGDRRKQLGDSLQLGTLGRIKRLQPAPYMAGVSFRFLEGGICVAARETFLAEGGLNLKMKSYGWEDTEMLKRFQKLGYPILHLPQYSLVHMDHARGVDSRPNEHYAINKAEFIKVRDMSRSELATYVATDLSISARGDAARLHSLRQVQHRRTAFLKARAFIILCWIHLQALGPTGVFAKLIKR